MGLDDRVCTTDRSASSIRQLPIPVPPLAQQRRIVMALEAIRTEVDKLKPLQSEISAELDALLPSILDRAFASCEGAYVQALHMTFDEYEQEYETIYTEFAAVVRSILS